MLILAVTFAGSGPSHAQKTVNVQKQGIWLPAKMKVDGSLQEWNGRLQARNRATRLDYTLANDEQNLYLAVRSTDEIVASKILSGGISLAVVVPGMKGAVPTITFPVRQIYEKRVVNGRLTPR